MLFVLGDAEDKCVCNCFAIRSFPTAGDVIFTKHIVLLHLACTNEHSLI